jgi:ribosome maturation factor RimP
LFVAVLSFRPRSPYWRAHDFAAGSDWRRLVFNFKRMQGHPTLFELVGTTLPALGFELVEVEVSDRGLVRVFIDKPGRNAKSRGDGITVDDCATVSHHLTRVFMVENVDFERLEVSSPGVDRPLRAAADFARFAGERAKIRLLAPINNRRNFEGVLAGVDAAGQHVALEFEGQTWDLPLVEIERARLIPDLDFRPEGKAKKPGKPEKAAKPDAAPSAPKTPKTPKKPAGDAKSTSKQKLK